MKRTIISVLVGLLVSVVYHNDARSAYLGSFSEFFLDRYPSARIGSLGTCAVAVKDAPALYNPAAFAFGEGFRVSFSRSRRFYLLQDADYKLTSLGCYIAKGWSISGSAYSLDYDDEIGTRWNTYSASLVLAMSRIAALGVGINRVHFCFRDPLGEKNASVIVPSFGAIVNLLQRNVTGQSHSLRVGISFFNPTNTRLTCPEFVTKLELELPVILRAGVAYMVSNRVDPTEFSLRDITGSAFFELTDVINSKYFTKLATGAEVCWAQLISFRIGYYGMKKWSPGDPAKYTQEDLTYGFGVSVPKELFRKVKVPASLEFDYLNLRQPKVPGVKKDWPNYQTYTIAVKIH